MDLLDRLLGHDVWTTRQLLGICAKLEDAQLDQEFAIGHKTLRATLRHIIHNMEIWSLLMADEVISQRDGDSISVLLDRLEVAANRLATVAREVAQRNAWDDCWTDELDDPPSQKSFGGGIAHIITHSMHHRAQVLHILRRLGVTDLPEGDVFSWEISLSDPK